jgi:Carbon starvation protein CstA
MNAFPILLGALCVYALAYRYYSAFIAAKALALDDRRPPDTSLRMGITIWHRPNGCCSATTLPRLPGPDRWWAPRWLPISALHPDFCGSRPQAG